MRQSEARSTLIIAPDSSLRIRDDEALAQIAPPPFPILRTPLGCRIKASGVARRSSSVLSQKQKPRRFGGVLKWPRDGKVFMPPNAFEQPLQAPAD